MLDVGCGWGSFAMHAAHATASAWSASRCPSRRPRARAAPRAEAGLADQVDIRVADYRELAGERFDAIASDRDGRARRRRADRRLRQSAGRRCWRPAGGCSTTGSPGCATATADAGPFSERYVFPDADAAAPVTDPARPGASGIRDRARRGLPRPTTPRRCATGPRASTPATRRRVALAGAERLRVWRLYLRAARNGFETGSRRSTRSAARGPETTPAGAFAPAGWLLC